MGNCLYGGFGEEDDELIKVITSNGGIMEFSSPISAQNIIIEFPDHAIFRSNDLFSKPAFHHEQLLPGKLPYYLLPLNGNESSSSNNDDRNIVREGLVRSDSDPINCSYRLSCDLQGTLKRSLTDIFSRRYNNNEDDPGFWKVKLVINQEQLLEILLEENRTHELIESVRTVAKCGNGFSTTSVGFSDRCSLLTSRNANSKYKQRLFRC